jgi:hypothetical protein
VEHVPSANCRADLMGRGFGGHLPVSGQQIDSALQCAGKSTVCSAVDFWIVREA